jgi:hypothetical protein
MSDPETAYPMARSPSATPDMPHPPMPMKWMGRSLDSSARRSNIDGVLPALK